MATAAHLIVDGKAEFNVMESYYRMFPHEMSTKPYFTYNLPAAQRISKITFEKLLDKMIDLMNAKTGVDNFVIVVHGLYDHGTDFGKGISVPLTDNTHMKASYDLLEPLLDFVNNKTSDEAMSDWEGNYSYTNSSLKLSNVKFPKGSVARIVGKMRQLRLLKVRCVEFRACNLGTNTAGLSTLGQCFGARFIVAPDRRMFFVSVGPALNKAPVFDRLAKSLKDARVFPNPANPSEKLAVQVHRGPGTSRTVDTITSSTHLKWFTDTFLWKGTTYADGAGRPAAFFMEGLDLPGTQQHYALPQEQAYRDHLIEVGPLPGNMI